LYYELFLSNIYSKILKQASKDAEFYEELREIVELSAEALP
jgi:hypothetical protein